MKIYTAAALLFSVAIGAQTTKPVEKQVKPPVVKAYACTLAGYCSKRMEGSDGMYIAAANKATCNLITGKWTPTPHAKSCHLRPSTVAGIIDMSPDHDVLIVPTGVWPTPSKAAGK